MNKRTLSQSTDKINKPPTVLSQEFYRNKILNCSLAMQIWKIVSASNIINFLHFYSFLSQRVQIWSVYGFDVRIAIYSGKSSTKMYTTYLYNIAKRVPSTKTGHSALSVVFTMLFFYQNFLPRYLLLSSFHLNSFFFSIIFFANFAHCFFIGCVCVCM